FLYPDRFGNATEEQWREHFAEPMRTGRVPGECLDFYIVCPLAEQEKNKEWKKSRLEDVKEFIAGQL
ncbi:MAG: CapA family protein, partial [Clostridia bacterium]|nr:CapA family protein [Clostridia bacterium]